MISVGGQFLFHGVIRYVIDSGVRRGSRWDFLMISRSMKLIWLLVSDVGERCMLLCMELAWCNVVSGLVRVAS